ncbi:MAG: ASCH domain-containing protein [Candidatus Paceibacterota bacterium]|jgi:ASC-1-like (ASCH) protein
MAAAAKGFEPSRSRTKIILVYGLFIALFCGINDLLMQQHQMKLATEPYNNIATGKKVIESRLFDEKRQQIAIGDQIVFSENDNPENSVTTTVKGLLRYQTFKELFADHDPALFGEKSRDFLLTQIKQFYPDEDEQKYGVVGIRLELLG